MLLSEDHLAVQDAVRTFVQAEIAPFAAAWDKSHTFPAAQLKGWANGSNAENAVDLYVRPMFHGLFA